MNVTNEKQPDDVRQIELDARHDLIISTVKIDGTWHVLSRYGDTAWELTGGATNKSTNTHRIDFSKIPTPFIEEMKAILYRYKRRGRKGQKQPGTQGMVSMFVDIKPFITHLVKHGITSFSEVTPFACSLYVNSVRDHRKPDGKPLSAMSLNQRFLAVEAVHELSQYTDNPIPSKPWRGSSALSLARNSGEGRTEINRRGGTTPLIPDEPFCQLFQAAWTLVQRADHLLDLRDELVKLVDERLENGQLPWTIYKARNSLLKKRGWATGSKKFDVEITDIRVACYIVIASLSGCRNHELAYVQTNAAYRTEDDDGETYWWMRSRSNKTDEGLTEWMIPESATIALRVMDRWSIPHRLKLQDEVENRRRQDPEDPEIARATRHSGAIFVGTCAWQESQVRTLSNTSWNYSIKKFAKKHGIDWTFTTHQFRRKFANYAARSQFGDLRYLKEHFKHWSFDMTLGYAMNEYQEIALYSEVFDELASTKEGAVESWMQSEASLAGGLGQRIVAWRGSHDVTIFKDHKSMVRALAEGFSSLRSNGHAWCSADQGIDCIGNGGLDRTRCTDCEHAVIGRRHAEIYQGIYDHLASVLNSDDIGESGIAYVRRSMDRCLKVLQALGAEPNALEVTA